MRRAARRIVMLDQHVEQLDRSLTILDHLDAEFMEVLETPSGSSMVG